MSPDEKEKPSDENNNANKEKDTSTKDITPPKEFKTDSLLNFALSEAKEKDKKKELED